MVWRPGHGPGQSTDGTNPTETGCHKPYQLRHGIPTSLTSFAASIPSPGSTRHSGETMGREPVSPRPVDMSQIYKIDYRFTNGFLTYSDGVHDDFNKQLWTQLGWNPDRDPREIAREYARFFFRSDLADLGADGLFGLENNTRGALADNGSIGATFLLWQELERRLPKENSNWRFRMHLFRAYYDFYTRERLIYETKLERHALELLNRDHDSVLEMAKVPSDLKDAREILGRATSQPIHPEIRTKLIEFGDELFQSIGLQTSVPKYDASGYERGAVLDFLDYPLNNRWWIEDQLDKIEKLEHRPEQRKQMQVIANWENPGEGGYYDVVGHVGRSPRIVKLLLAPVTPCDTKDIPMPTQRWVGEKRIALRQAWHSYMDTIPAGITYNDLDSSSKYIVKLFAQRESPLVIDGVKADRIKKGETFDQVTEQIFEVPAEAGKDGRLTLTWEAVPDEANMNWRRRHYVTDIWVIKLPAEPADPKAGGA